jgi:hypothetical protein
MSGDRKRAPPTPRTAPNDRSDDDLSRFHSPGRHHGAGSPGIQDPANRVQQFFFDDGWEAVALSEQRPAALAVEFPQLATTTGAGGLPVFDLRDGLEVPAGYLKVDEAVLVDGQFVVQVRGSPLADRYPPATLVLVEPSGEAPDEGEVILVELGAEDPDTGLRLTIRTWWKDGTAVTLGGGNGVAPLPLTQRPCIIGRVAGKA